MGETKGGTTVSVYDYEYICAYCGKKFSGRKQINRRFCSTECKNAANKEAIPGKRLSVTEPVVPPQKCKKCVHGAVAIDNVWPICNYIFDTGKSRVQMHPEGLTAQCREFAPKAGRSRRAPLTVKGRTIEPSFDDSSKNRDADDLRKIQKKIKAYCLE